MREYPLVGKGTGTQILWATDGGSTPSSRSILKSLNSMNITMTKVGKFSTNRERAATYQCGTQGMTVFDYEVSITTSNEALNKNTGFIIDNAAIAEYFDNYHTHEEITPSCELIACNALDYFRTLFTREGVDVKRINVRIQGSLTAYFNANWKQKKKKLPHRFEALRSERNEIVGDVAARF